MSHEFVNCNVESFLSHEIYNYRNKGFHTCTEHLVAAGSTQIAQNWERRSLVQPRVGKQELVFVLGEAKVASCWRSWLLSLLGQGEPQEKGQFWGPSSDDLEWGVCRCQVVSLGRAPQFFDQQKVKGKIFPWQNFSKFCLYNNPFILGTKYKELQSFQLTHTVMGYYTGVFSMTITMKYMHEIYHIICLFSS